jgi:protein gp37
VVRGGHGKQSWTDHTYSAWLGCTKVSPGCDFCYAEAQWDHRYHRVEWGPHGERSRTKTDGDVLRFNRRAEKSGVRERVFTASSSDVFDNQAPDEWRSDLFALIRQCTALDWLVLTKRPQNILKMLPQDWGDGWPHVWIGCTVENQEEAERRIPHLRAVPARIRFLSCEPLLEPVQPDLSGISWIICGGESGRFARTMDPAWARQLRDQCANAGVAYFFKQVGSDHRAWPGVRQAHGEDPAEWPEDLRERQFPTALHVSGQFVLGKLRR